MIDKEHYQRAFGVLHASGDFLKEDITMQKTRHFSMRRVVFLCAAVITVISLATVCYAADMGGIRRTVQLWIHGDQTTAVMDIRNGSYDLTYEDDEGIIHQVSGGGVSFEEDGSERPLTEEELIEHLNSPDVQYREDGSVWLYFMDQSMEITHKFNEENVCFVQLTNGEETLYLTIKYKGGFAYSPERFIQPDQFSIGKE